LFTKINEIVSEKDLVDFGCGKGRVLVVAAHYNFKMITGIDFAKELAIAAALTVSKASQNLPDTEFKIEWIDASAYAVLPSQNVFFFFNPFKKVVMKQVMQNILFSKREHSRPMYVIYVNPVLKDLFIDAGFTEKYHHKKMEYVEGVILELL
jgi:ribosomal protein L11 methylase PrmA